MGRAEIVAACGVATYSCMACALHTDAQPTGTCACHLAFLTCWPVNPEFFKKKKKKEKKEKKMFIYPENFWMVHPRERASLQFTQKCNAGRGVSENQEVNLHSTPLVSTPPTSCQWPSSLSYKLVQKQRPHYVLKQPSSSSNVSVTKYFLRGSVLQEEKSVWMDGDEGSPTVWMLNATELYTSKWLKW